MEIKEMLSIVNKLNFKENTIQSDCEKIIELRKIYRDKIEKIENL